MEKVFINSFEYRLSRINKSITLITGTIYNLTREQDFRQLLFALSEIHYLLTQYSHKFIGPLNIYSIREKD